MRALWRLQLIIIVGLGSVVAAQQGPAISGFTGTLATEATIKDEQKAGNTVAVKTKDGVEHVYSAAKVSWSTGATIHWPTSNPAPP